MADEGDDFSFKVWQFKLGITSESEGMTKYKGIENVRVEHEYLN